MDKIDTDILACLKENGRATASDISRQISLSVPAVAERIRKLEQAGTIQGYTARINRSRVGCGLLAFLLVNLDKTEAIGPFRAQMRQNPHVLECHHIAGQADYLLKVAVSATEELERFLMEELKTIPGVASSNTLICLSTIKEEINL